MKKSSSAKLKNHDCSSSNIMLLVMKELNLTEADEEKPKAQNLEILTLAHPCDKRKALFLWNSNDGTIQEILKYSQPYRSWFIGNTVESDGKIYLSTPVDPLFLVLPYICEANMSSTLDQLIEDETFKDSRKLEAILDEKQLLFIADRRECQDLIVWKYNETKTLSWLSTKVKKVATALEEKGIHVSASAAVSNTYVKSVNQKESPENYMRYAYGIVSEYIPPAVSEKLLSSLDLPTPEPVTKKRKTIEIDAEEIKKLRMESTDGDLQSKYFAEESKSEPKSQRKNVRQAALLAKAATGTKSISSFFKKK